MKKLFSITLILFALFTANAVEGTPDSVTCMNDAWDYSDAVGAMGGDAYAALWDYYDNCMVGTILILLR